MAASYGFYKLDKTCDAVIKETEIKAQFLVDGLL